MLTQKASIKKLETEKLFNQLHKRNMLNFLKMMIYTGKKFTAYATRLPLTLSHMNFNKNCYTDIWPLMIF